MEGGEIFVPKIPSMKILDLANAISNDTREIGLRPGEKLHESMISEDEARNTIEHDDYYAIMPHSPLIRSQISKAYTSDTNSMWLTPEQIKEMIKCG
jgi:UDP-N-acetylglucosamine 4,6-dehydratase